MDDPQIPESKYEPPPAPKPAAFLHYTIADMIGVMFIIGAHFVFWRSMMESKTHIETHQLVALVILGPLFPIGASYLALRLATANKIESIWQRMGLVLFFEFVIITTCGVILFAFVMLMIGMFGK